MNDAGKYRSAHETRNPKTDSGCYGSHTSPFSKVISGRRAQIALGTQKRADTTADQIPKGVRTKGLGPSYTPRKIVATLFLTLATLGTCVATASAGSLAIHRITTANSSANGSLQLDVPESEAYLVRWSGTSFGDGFIRASVGSEWNSFATTLQNSDGAWQQTALTIGSPERPIEFTYSMSVGYQVNEWFLSLDTVEWAPYLLGDFNLDGAVDAADYTVWRDELECCRGQHELEQWKQNFGQTTWTSSAGNAASLPEPSAILAMLMAFGIWLIWSGGRSRSVSSISGATERTRRERSASASARCNGNSCENASDTQTVSRPAGHLPQFGNLKNHTGASALHEIGKAGGAALLAIAVLLSGSACWATTYSDTIADAYGVAAHWRFGEASGTNINDEISTHDLTASNVTLASTALLTGDATTSGSFNGTSSEANTGDNTFGDITSLSQQWMVEAWVRPNVTRGGGNQQYTIFSKMLTSSPFTGIDCQLQWNGSTTIMRGFVIADFGTSNYVLTSGSTDLQNGTTYHLVWMWNGTNLVLFVNGVLEAVGNSPGISSAPSNSVPISIGSRGGSTLWFAGNIQDVAFYLMPSDLGVSGNRALGHYHIGSGRTPPADTPNPNIIFDCDFNLDVDDAGDLAILCTLANQSECTLVGVVLDEVNNFGAPVAEAICDYYGQTPTYGAWQGGVTTEIEWTEAVADRFNDGVGRAAYTDSTEAYRQMLHDADDDSIVIVAAGRCYALADLLASSADGIDSRNGSDLIAAKVKRLVIVAGIMPTGIEPNFFNAPQEAHDVFDGWPTPIIVPGIEMVGVDDPFRVISGPPDANDPLVDPVKYSYDEWGADDNSPPLSSPSGKRAAWGQLGILYAVRGLDSGFEWGGINGSQTVNASTGENIWTSTSGDVSFLNFNTSGAAMSATFDGMFKSTGNQAAGAFYIHQMNQ